MLQSSLRELDRLAAAGALTPAELARARAQVIANYLAKSPNEVAPAPSPAPPAQHPAVPPAPPKGVGPIPRRMVPVALALGSAVVVDGVVASAMPEGVPSVGSGDFAG